MAQIKKGFIAPNAIDGSKLRLLNNEAIRALAADGSDVEVMKIDVNSVLQFLRTPQVSADPANANDVSRKSWVDAQVSSEATTRSQADAALQTALNQEISARSTADSQEATARAQGDATLQAAIAALSLDSLTDVEMSSPEAGDVLRYVDGKWKKESPISAREAGSAPAVETVHNYAPATPGEGTAWIVPSNYSSHGQMFEGISGSLSKFEINVFQFSAATGTTTVRLYETTSQLLAGPVILTDYPLGPVLATASLDVSTIGYGGAARWASFVFSSPATLDPAKNYLILIQHGGSQNWLFNANTLNISGSSGFKRVDTFSNGNYLSPNSSSDLDFKLTTMSGGGSSLSNAGGVIKSNEDGFVDTSLLQYNVDFGGNKLSGVSAPEAGTDAANKTWVEGQVAAEATARSSADASLQSQVNTEKGRIDAILLASTADKDSFAEIVTLINSVDTTNDQAFASYVLSNNAALAQEVSNRETGDSTLQSNLDAEESTREAADLVLQGNIDSEETARIAADGVLQDAIDQEVSDREAAVSAEQSARQSAISAEQTARQAADTDLSDRLDVVEGADTVEGSIAKAEKDAKDHADSIVAAEQAAREAEDAALDARLDILQADPTTKTYVDAADQDLQDQIDALIISAGGDTAAEAALRIAGDNNLQSQIDAILSASTADADSFKEIVDLINSVDTTNDQAFAGYVSSNNAALAQETSERESADTLLQSNIDAEESAREAANAALQSDIADEASARQSADDALDARVDALEAVSEGRAKFVITQTDLDNQYVTLSHVAKTDSTFMFYGPLYLHEGDDYTVSTVGGVSRLTFSGRIASGQPSQPIVGDTIYVRYKH